MQEEIGNKEIKKAKIETKPYYYTEDEVDLIVETKGREDSFIVSIMTIKGTINFLEYKKKRLEEEIAKKGTVNFLGDKKKRLEEEIAKIQKEIDDNQQWLKDVKDDLAKIKYFKFEE